MCELRYSQQLCGSLHISACGGWPWRYFFSHLARINRTVDSARRYFLSHEHLLRNRKTTACRYFFSHLGAYGLQCPVFSGCLLVLFCEVDNSLLVAGGTDTFSYLAATLSHFNAICTHLAATFSHLKVLSSLGRPLNKVMNCCRLKKRRLSGVHRLLTIDF